MFNEFGEFVWRKTYTVVLAAILLLCVTFMTAGINNSGFRTVVQWPNGNVFVKMDEGIYLSFFGKTTEYPDVITHELVGSYEVSVRYQDGGTGSIEGVVRLALPTDQEGMLSLHRAVREPEGLRNKLIYPEVKQALNLTAGLMTSEEAYAVKRNDYANWATDQIQNGRYQTVLLKRKVTTEDGKTQVREVPVIKTDEQGNPVYQASAVKEYGLRVVGFQITDWDFEAKTLAQISDKREAEMAIITAKANASKAVWQQKQIKADGEKEVERVRYEQLRLKEEATIKADREKEVAVIAAEKVKEVNKEKLEAATIDVKTAEQEAQALRTRKDAEAYGKKVIILADGALDKKLAAYIETQTVWAQAFSNRKVPSMVFGSSGNSGGVSTDATQFQTMLNALIAKDLVVDTVVTK